MMKFEKVTSLPEAIKPYVEGPHYATRVKLISSFIDLSYDIAYCTEDDEALFLIGAYKTSTFSEAAELWFCPTKKLQARHIRPLKKELQKWIAQQPYKIFARCAEASHGKFVKLMGFKFKKKDGIMLLFEAGN